MKMDKKIIPYHFTQAFDIKAKESDLDFFDVNLRYDSRLFIDPFLIKRSPVVKERELFNRFGIFFKLAVSKSISTKTEMKKIDELYEFMSFHEPREISLGYTENSNKGSGLSSQFATSLFHFFLSQSAARVITDETLYKNKQIDPEIFALFTDGVADDGISDLSANLLMDYFIKYTQQQCKKWGIKLKKILPVSQTFDFEELNWTGGVNEFLPENPLRPGEPIVLIPKRFLRAGEKLSEQKVVHKAVGVLRQDPYLSKKFSGVVTKSLDNVSIKEIRKVLTEEGVLKKYIELSEGVIPATPYDFEKDIFHFLAFKKLENLFKKEKKRKNPHNPAELLLIVNDFISYIKEYLEEGDGIKLMWYTKDKKRYPVTELSWGRLIRGLGALYFRFYPQITFDPEVSMKRGLADFRVVYKDMRIVIELKRLDNTSPKGKPPIPSYLHGIKRQLPLYAKETGVQYAIYITGQFYKKTDKEKIDIWGKRIKEISSCIPKTKQTLKTLNHNFVDLFYYNFEMTEKPSASNI